MATISSIETRGYISFNITHIRQRSRLYNRSDLKVYPECLTPLSYPSLDRDFGGPTYDTSVEISKAFEYKCTQNARSSHLELKSCVRIGVEPTSKTVR